MRWDRLLVDHDEPAAVKLPTFSDEALVRRFETPEFKGMTFYEVKARSIINHVKGSRFGFDYTINPYRGCSHACVYCLAGETPVLTADGRHKPIADLVVGDAIYGTAGEGRRRSYVATSVLAHWETERPAYRLTLQDGTELVATGDHRFLTDKGWKYVTGSRQGALRRPYLTTSNKLVGTGAFAAPPAGGVDYQRGYLCAMARGDANLASQLSQPAGRKGRGVLVDLEGVKRARSYLAEQAAVGKLLLANGAAQMKDPGLGLASLASSTVLRELIEFPSFASGEWRKGFLAGIFDTAGSYRDGVLQVANTDPLLVDLVLSCMRDFGLDATVEPSTGAIRASRVRMLGDLSQHLRFFHICDPAVTRKRTIERALLAPSTDLRVAEIEPLGEKIPMFDITTGTGDFIANGVVSHNCFARPTHTYLDFNAGVDFGTKIVVKTNAVELLRRELARKSWPGEHIAMGTNTDNYQRAEGRYKLMRGILTELNAARNPYSILTKSTLIQRDLDLLTQGAAVTSVSACFSVGTVDENVWKQTEPGTPHPLKRMEVVAKLNQAGINCGVMMAPILPGISDSKEQLEATVKAAVAAGATSIVPLVLHLRPGVREEFMGWLEDAHPELVGRYEDMYSGTYAKKATSQPITGAVNELKSKHRASPDRSAPDPMNRPPRFQGNNGHKTERASLRVASQGPPEPEQMSFDLGSRPKRRAPGWVRDSIPD
jgi:DNA repair photolyase